MVLRRVLQRTPDGDFELQLSSEERGLLRALPRELRTLLDEEGADPTLRRLFPPAYEDAGAEAEYRRLMQGELASRHRQALLVLEQTADRERLRDEEVHAWLSALNDLRLVLGTRLGVTEDLYEQDVDPDAPGAAQLGVFLYLTWLQEQFVEAAADLPRS
jgi:hypothetical protein